MMEDSPTANDTITLCISGGGYRAAAFHLGALRRLHEIGLLGRIRRISSVSGGSILSAHLAQCMVEFNTDSLSFTNWNEQVANPFRKRILSKDIRTQPFLKQWTLPWNWFRAGPAVSALEGQYYRHLTRLLLHELPDSVRFTFCSTDLLYGVNWTFERDRIGDYKSRRFASPKDFTVAKAVAASSCFPPVFLPMKMKLNRTQRAKTGLPKVIHLSDGGVYDNLGVQPVWRKNPVLLVSDGGSPFTFEPGSNPLMRLKRYIAISTNQGLSLRWRWLIARFKDDNDITGTSWRIGSWHGKYSGAVAGGYTKDFSRNVIAKIRTDMNAFSSQEIDVLENHGYLMTDAAVRTNMIKWLPEDTKDTRVPNPELMDESKAKKYLSRSGSRRPVRSMLHFFIHPLEPFRPRLSKNSNNDRNGNI